MSKPTASKPPASKPPASAGNAKGVGKAKRASRTGLFADVRSARPPLEARVAAKPPRRGSRFISKVEASTDAEAASRASDSASRSKSASTSGLAAVIAEVVADSAHKALPLRSFHPDPVPGSFDVASPWSGFGRGHLVDVVGEAPARKLLGDVALRADLVFRVGDVFAEVSIGEALAGVHLIDPASCLLHPVLVSSLVDAYLADGAMVHLVDRDDVPPDLTGRWDALRARLPSIALSGARRP